jgi:hypothetical protein
MASPGSELHTFNWLKNKSAVGELLGFNFESCSQMSLYRISDLLFKHKESIEQKLFKNIEGLLFTESQGKGRGYCQSVYRNL